VFDFATLQLPNFATIEQAAYSLRIKPAGACLA
jgi:hypothetical protein